MKPSGPLTRPNKLEVQKAIRYFAGTSIRSLESQLAALKQNLSALSGPETKIVSLAERRKIKFAVAIVQLVIADRHGWVMPEEKI